MALKKKFVADDNASLPCQGAIRQASLTTSAEVMANPSPTALDEIWRTHSQQILRITQGITHNREDAEDALQDSFLRAYLYLHNFDGRSSLLTWLTRIAINSALLILRRRASASQLSIDEEGDSAVAVPVTVADSSPGPEARYAEIERRAIVRSEIAKLRPSIRRALELQTLEQWSLRETAEHLGISIIATKSRIFQAKSALRESLGRKVGRAPGEIRSFKLSPA
jgi:RNA polymerase sigma factor (sigma-70 family)